MIKGTLRDMLKKLRKKIDLEILIYTIMIVLTVYSIFRFMSIDAGGKEVTTLSKSNDIVHYDQSNLQNTYTSRVIESTNEIVELDIEDAQLLMRLAWSEAGNQGIEGQLVIMNVVMNRVADENFPDNVKDVIYQKLGNYYQFSVVGNGVFQKAEPTEETHLALADLESGKDISQGALYFEATGGKSWHKKNRTFLFEDYGQRFYK